MILLEKEKIFLIKKVIHIFNIDRTGANATLRVVRRREKK